MLLTPKPFF